MATELKPCPFCGAKLRKKTTVRKEIVYDHPRNGCKNEGYRCRGYKEAIITWNRRAEDATD